MSALLPGVPRSRSSALFPRRFSVLDGATLGNDARNHAIPFQHEELDLVLAFEGACFVANAKAFVDVILDALRDDDVVQPSQGGPNLETRFKTAMEVVYPSRFIRLNPF